MRGNKWVLVIGLICLCATAQTAWSLPFSTVFKGEDQFNRLVAKAKEGNWKTLPIGERTATVGQALVGTRYKHFTLEIDNHIEAASVNFNGMDCWTFFEISLAFARMLNEPEENWTPQQMLHYIEVDRYRGGECTGDYLSRLHYLEDWLADNKQRGLVEDLTPHLGGKSVAHSAREMTIGWRHYRYLAANKSLLGPLAQMERASLRGRFTRSPRTASPKSNLNCRAATSSASFRAMAADCSPRRMWVWRCARVTDLHFMHASSPGNSGRVVVDSRISKYLARYRSDSGILVARPLR